MSTYLELCQEVALQSGTVPTLGEPSTVTGASGRLQRITGWVAKAWEDIQRQSDDWRWMSAEFDGQTIAGVADYDSTAMGITDRFRKWNVVGEDNDDIFTIYETAVGNADEGVLQFKDYHWMRRNVLLGDWEATERRSKPGFITVTPEDKLLLYPVPDTFYQIRGRYRKSPQVLTADADIPEMPETFHELIVWKALVRLAIFDEAFSNLQAYERMYTNILFELGNDQLPRITKGMALA